MRRPLSRERVLDAALALTDRDGIDALTMRRLAQELGVEAMTLYYHVENKEAILAELVERVAAQFALPNPGGAWKAELRASAISAYRTLERHPWAAGLMLSGQRVSTARLAYMNAILGTLGSAGFSPRVTDHAYHALEGHIMGFTLWEVGMNLGPPENVAALATGFLRELPRDRYPHIAEHIEHHLRPRPSSDEGSFAFALDLLLDGLEHVGRRER